MTALSHFRFVLWGVLFTIICSAESHGISASYDPSTGSVHFMDVVKPPEGFGYQLVLESMGGNLLPGTTTPPFPVPGASADESNLPTGLYWYWLDEPPVPDFSVENVVNPGTPVSDLSFGYGYSILVSEIIVRGLPLQPVPEPAVMTMVAAVLMGLALRRRSALR